MASTAGHPVDIERLLMRLAALEGRIQQMVGQADVIPFSILTLVVTTQADRPSPGHPSGNGPGSFPAGRIPYYLSRCPHRSHQPRPSPEM
jgi:hypothetical protein